MNRRRFHRRAYLGILRAQRLRCFCGCGVKLTRKEGYQFDHEHDLALGGPDTPENLQALRTPCHLKKSRKGAAMRAKAKRIARKLAGTWKRRGPKLPSRPFGQPRPFDTTLRRRFDGRVEVRT